MCMICVDFEAGKMTVQEGWRNFDEMVTTLPHEHHDDVIYMLWEAEQEEEDHIE
jgi:hypothetical protein